MQNRNHAFHQLHHNGKLLVLPNIWDPFGAILLEDLGFQAVATSSSALALSQGYKDGEKLPFEELLKTLSRMVNSVKIPVSADIETAYADTDTELSENIKKLIDTGISGINYEDSSHESSKMQALKTQCHKLEIIKSTCLKYSSDLFINARVDTYIKADQLTDDEKLSETIIRGKAYKEAGADGLYPIILKNRKHIKALVTEVQLPLNITMIQGIPDFEELQNLGVVRLSMASGYFKNAAFTMKQTANNLLKHTDMEEILNSMVTSDYLNKLVH